eukprot:20796-Heterococcus_DN1.PRE.5
MLVSERTHLISQYALTSCVAAAAVLHLWLPAASHGHTAGGGGVVCSGLAAALATCSCTDRSDTIDSLANGIVATIYILNSLGCL